MSQIGLDPGELQGLEIRFWHPWTDETGQLIHSLVKEFNTSNQWGIRVQDFYQGNLDKTAAAVPISLGTDNQPDVLVAYPYQALQWQQGEAVLDLSTYLQDPLLGLDASQASGSYPAFWQSDNLAGKRVGVPAQRSGEYLYYNQTWAEELGFDQPPSTLQGFKEQACAAAESLKKDNQKENDGKGGAILTNSYSAALSWIAAFGGEVAGSEAGGYQFNSGPVEEVFRYLRELYDQGCAWYDEDANPEQEFADRLGLFSPGSLAGIPYQQKVLNQAGNRDEWTLIPFPSPNGDPAVDAYGPDYVLLKSTPKRQLAAWLFVRWLLNPDQQSRLVQAGGTFPLQESVLERSGAYASRHPQWSAAMTALASAKAEPPYASWNTVRWAVSDAMTQLFRYYYSSEQAADLAKLLDDTARELNSR